MVPLVTKRAASFPVNSAVLACRADNTLFCISRVGNNIPCLTEPVPPVLYFNTTIWLISAILDFLSKKDNPSVSNHVQKEICNALSL